MALQHQDIQRIAHLAKLDLQASESDALLAQLNSFFHLVEAMQAVDTAGVEPLTHPVAAIEEVALRLREDVVGDIGRREDSQRSAPAVERGLFLVPKVIE
ncbi:MAG: Asp-tRNA(Asn)/Glu-tRNA(Gln) amidotransferase subunit GatC [Xylophilus ampelinus]